MRSSKNNKRWVIAAILYLSAVTMSLIWTSLGPMMMEIIAQFDISLAKAGLLSGVVACILGIFASISGLLSTKLGIKNTACTGIIIMAVGCLLSGMASEYDGVLLGRIIFSVGAGFFFPMLGAMIMQWFEGDELVMINSINLSGTAVGSTIGLAITVPIMHALGWQNTLVTYGIICGAVALLATLLLTENKGDNVNDGGNDTRLIALDIYLDVLKRKETWLLALAFAAPVSISVITHAFLPTYFVETKGVSIKIASLWTSSVYLIGIPAAIIGGILGVKAGVRKPLLIANGLMLGAGFLGSVFLDGLVFNVCLGFVGIGLLFFTGVFYTIPMELDKMTPESAGAMFGIITFIAMQFGFTAPMFVGWLELKTGSLVTGLVFYGVFGFMMAICTFFLDETGPKAVSKRIQA